MPIRVAINGFGRIGRLTFRNLMANPDKFDVVAVNDLTDNRTLATLLKYDSIHGRYPGTVEFDDKSLTVDGKKIQAMAVRNPAELPWGDLGAEFVLESTGVFRGRANRQGRLRQPPGGGCQEGGHQCPGQRARPDVRFGGERQGVDGRAFADAYP